MGMAASQARLLSITARLSNNENDGQSISYAKQRLSDQTQEITNAYNEALDATKLTVLTGFNGSDANYTDISYSLMTSLSMAESTRQYVITDTKGRILVTENIANAYKASNGNYNQFLANLGYSQADITVQKTYTDVSDRTDEQLAAEQKIHEAWDAYFATVGINLGDFEHDFGFSWTETYLTDEDGYTSDKTAIGCGYAGYARIDEDGKYLDAEYNTIDYNAYSTDITDNPEYTKGSDGYYVDSEGNKIAYDAYSTDTTIIYDPINYEGTTQESRDLYDYAMALTEAYLRTDASGTDFGTEYDSSSLNTAASSDNTSALTYYKNLFTKMQSSGYFTYTNSAATANADPEHYIYASTGTGTAGNVQKSPLYDNTAFEQALRDGTLLIEYYSSTEKGFVSTSISEDSCIQEVSDETAIAKAEAQYTQDMNDLENKDKKFDLELKKLDTEHSALQTEYDSVKNVVDKNVENSFKTFG